MRRKLARLAMAPAVLLSMLLDGSLFRVTERCEREAGSHPSWPAPSRSAQ